jgi:multicomponent Na+:H+ antiporter subunit E
VTFRRKDVGRALLLLALLSMAWLLWSGQVKPLLLGLGLFSCLLTTYISHRMGFFDDDIFSLRFAGSLTRYWGWLAKEVVRSSIEVARIVMDPRLPISPHVIEIKATVTHPVYQVFLANSITLTPGTLALDVHRGVIKVHTLTRGGADDVLAGEMDRRIAALQGD